jgi:hypothetical protein
MRAAHAGSKRRSHMAQREQHGNREAKKAKKEKPKAAATAHRATGIDSLESSSLKNAADKKQ